MTPIRIGIAGYMGSGKSTFGKHLSIKGGAVFDADLIAKDLMNTNSEIKKRLTDKFGNDILCGDRILFNILGKVCFNSSSNLSVLNSIVHPPLIKRLRSLLYDTNEKLCILDAALISFWRIENWFDILYWIQAPAEIRLRRLLQGVTISPEELKKRMKIQENLFPEPIEGKWIIISNEGTFQEFEKTIEKNNLAISKLLATKLA